MLPMLSLLRSVSLRTWAIGGVLAAALAFGVVQSLRLAGTQAALADATRDHAVQIAQLQQAAYTQAELMRATERQWQVVQHENARIANEAREQAMADAAAADAAAGRLRERFAALAGACRPSADGAAAVAAGRAASAPADLLADVLSRMDEAARHIAAFADAASISGEQCAADYRALTEALR